MNCIGGIEQSLPPGVFLLAAGGVDGLFVEVGGHFFSDAAEDATAVYPRVAYAVEFQPGLFGLFGRPYMRSEGKPL